MKIDLDIVHSCSIKRKKPWPKISWIGKEKEQLFLFDSQRISVLDPKTGKTRKKVNKLSNLIKNVVSVNLSNSKICMVGILNSGDLFVWNKDTDTIKSITGMKDFAYKLGFHTPSVYISDDATKILIVTSRNKIFVFESDVKPKFNGVSDLCSLIGSAKNTIDGNWSAVIAPNDIKSVEDSKELTVHARFQLNEIGGTTGTCCLAFNYEGQFVVTVLQIRWLNRGDVATLSQCHFESTWTNYFPSVADRLCPKFEMINSRGTYVCKLSNKCDLIALAINQKHVHKTCLTFMSPINGAIFQVNLRNFGLSEDAKGRHYWIQDMTWMHNDLYLAVITKHGAVFIVPRLGNPVLIKANGADVAIGPSIYITFHPLIVIKRNKDNDPMNGTTTNTINSINTDTDTSAQMKQHYSIISHTRLPVFVCSDGYLITIFSLKPKLASELFLIREFIYDTIHLINSTSKSSLLSTDKLKRHISPERTDEMPVEIPEWNLNTIRTQHESRTDNDNSAFVDMDDNASDSGVEYDDKNNALISDGKIIFSYIPQIMPISYEKLESTTLTNKIEMIHEHLQNIWSLLMASSLSNQATNDDNRQAIRQATNIFESILLKFIVEVQGLSRDQLVKLKFFNVHDAEEDFGETKLKFILFDVLLDLYKISYFNVAKSSHAYNMSVNILCRVIDSLLAQANLVSYMVLIKYLYRFVDIVDNMYDHCVYMDNCWLVLFRHLKASYDRLDSNLVESTRLRKSYEYFLILLQNNLSSHMSMHSVRFKGKVNTGYEFYLNKNLANALKCWKDELHAIIHGRPCNASTAQGIAHRILYVAFMNLRLVELVNTINELVLLPLSGNEDNIKASVLCINLYENTFLLLNSKKHLRSLHSSITSMLQSMARLLALYLLNNSDLLIYKNKKNNKFIRMPSLIDMIKDGDVLSNTDLDPIQLSKVLITDEIKSKKNLKKVFNFNKVVELFVLTGLYDEAVYFAYLINDIKSAYLLTAILYNQDKVNELKINFNFLVKRLLFHDDYHHTTTTTVDTRYGYLVRNEGLLNKIFLSTVLIANLDIVKLLLRNLLDKLASVVQQQLGVLVDDEFYLPAPPSYCDQSFNEQHNNTEYRIRVKLNSLIKYISHVLVESNLHVSLIKWYLNELHNSQHTMHFNLNISNEFKMTSSLDSLLKLVKYHKVNSINEEILHMFRDFCAFLFYLDVRDKYSLNLRKFSAISDNSQHNANKTRNKICLSIIENGNCLLSFRCLFAKQHQQHCAIQNSILNAIVHLYDHNTNPNRNEFELERSLVNCVLKQPIDDNNGNNKSPNEIFTKKLESILNKWKSNQDLKLFDVYTNLLNTKRSQGIKILTEYGLPEDVLGKVYIQKLPRTQPNSVGSYDYERTRLCSEFFELLFKIGFNGHENWDNFTKCINKTPLLPEFYDTLYDSNLNFNLNEYKYRDSNKPRRRFVTHGNELLHDVSNDSFELTGGHRHQLDSMNTISLEKNYRKISSSLVDLRCYGDSLLSVEKLRKCVSFSGRNNDSSEAKLKMPYIEPDSTGCDNDEPADNLNECRVTDYGATYEHTTRLAIWLVKLFRNINLNEILSGSMHAAYKLTGINPTMLVGCVYLLNLKSGNDEWKYIETVERAAMKKPSQAMNDELTDVTNMLTTTPKQHDTYTNNVLTSSTKNYFKSEIIHENDDDNDQSESTTLNMSSLEDEPMTLDEYRQDRTDNTNNNNNNNNKMPKTPDFVSRPTETSQKLTSKSNADEISRFTTITSDCVDWKPAAIVAHSTAGFDSHQTQSGSQLAPVARQPTTQMPMNEIIRDEIKKIVQMQHDVVMGFLNGPRENPMKAAFNAPAKPSNNSVTAMEANLIDQIKTAVLSNADSTAGPVEFIIETKVRTKSDPIEQTVSPSRVRRPDSLINIPLLNSNRQANGSTAMHVPSQTRLVCQLPQVKDAWAAVSDNVREQHAPKHTQAPKTLKSNSVNRRSEPITNQLPQLLTSKRLNANQEPIKQIESRPIPSTNRFIEDFIKIAQSSRQHRSTSHNFPLLRLSQRQSNRAGTSADVNQQQKLNLASNKNIDDNDNEAAVPSAPPLAPAVDHQQAPIDTKVDKTTEATRPIYDGYLLKPGIFDDMLVTNDMAESALNVNAHYRATEHLRQVVVGQKAANGKRDMFTLTDNIDNSNQVAISPDILFKLKFDAAHGKGRATNAIDNYMPETGSNDYVNVADLDSRSVEDVLKMIENEQDKRVSSKKRAIVPPKQLPSATNANDAYLRGILDDGILDGPSVVDMIKSRPDPLTERLFMDDDNQRLNENNMSSDARRVSRKHVNNDLHLIDEKIKIMNEIAVNMDQDYSRYNAIIDTLDDYNRLTDITKPGQDVLVPAICADVLADDKKTVKYYKPSDAIEAIEEFKRTIDDDDNNNKPQHVVCPIDSQNRLPSETRHIEPPPSPKMDDDDDLSDLRDNERAKLKQILAIESTTSLENLLDSTDTLVASHEYVPTSQVEHNKPVGDIKRAQTVTKPSISNKSPVRRNKSPTVVKKLNVTYKVPTSHLVQMEKENALRRDNLKQQHMAMREFEATRMMSDMFASEPHDHHTSHRFRTDSTRQNTSQLYDSMTRETLRLQNENRLKELQAEQLFNELRDRSSSRTSRQVGADTKTKQIESYRNFVHMQDPGKLKQNFKIRPHAATVTHARVQSRTDQKENTSKNIYKIFGTKRVPGLYKAYEKSPDERKTKTYSQRLRELRPNVKYQAAVGNGHASGTFRPNGKHNLLNKKKTPVHHKDLHRYRPYDVQVNETDNDALSWSIDDKIHNILYGTPKKSKKDIDEDTLADIDDFNNNDYYQHAAKYPTKSDGPVVNDNYNRVYDDCDYVDDVNTDDLKNIVSLSSESNLSYIDWDQIARLTGTL